MTPEDQAARSQQQLDNFLLGVVVARTGWPIERARQEFQDFLLTYEPAWRVGAVGFREKLIADRAVSS